jgi:hypothetical protein
MASLEGEKDICVGKNCGHDSFIWSFIKLELVRNELLSPFGQFMAKETMILSLFGQILHFGMNVVIEYVA